MEVHFLRRDTGPGDSGEPENPERRRNKDGHEIKKGEVILDDGDHR
jgi:hypothetical protein